MKHRTLWDYFSSHVKPTKDQDFYRVVKPLKVFKKVLYRKAYFDRDAIASLLITPGSIIYCPWEHRLRKCLIGTYNKRKPSSAFSSYPSPRFFKMRATSALVVQIATLTGAELVDVGHSRYSYSFLYKTGERVRPRYAFSQMPDECESGIHFFLTLAEAKAW